MNAPAHKHPMLAIATLSLLGPLACATSAAQTASTGTQTAQDTPVAGSARMPAGLSAVPGIRQPKPGLYTAGQPESAQWRGVADAGVTTVIDLRPDAETEGRDERAEVDAAGMRYVNIPVAGAGDINDANADALAQALRDADGPVLVHCASGNRVGALLAIGAARAGMPVEEAIAYGRSAGLGSGAEAVVRKQLAAPAAAEGRAD